MQNDVIYGGKGADSLGGGKDDDILMGNAGKDIITGKRGGFDRRACSKRTCLFFLFLLAKGLESCGRPSDNQSRPTSFTNAAPRC